MSKVIRQPWLTLRAVQRLQLELCDLLGRPEDRLSRAAEARAVQLIRDREQPLLLVLEESDLVVAVAAWGGGHA